jgi:hypothetical protein
MPGRAVWRLTGRIPAASRWRGWRAHRRQRRRGHGIAEPAKHSVLVGAGSVPGRRNMRVDRLAGSGCWLLSDQDGGAADRKSNRKKYSHLNLLSAVDVPTLDVLTLASL